MANPDQIAQIVAGLTEVQRGFIASRMRLVYRTGRMSDALVDVGILVKGGGNWTPLGLAVRRHIQGEG